MFKLHECQLSRSQAQIEVLMDDNLFPAYVSPKIRGRSSKIEDSRFPGPCDIQLTGVVGDAFIRELDSSQVTLRVVEKNDPRDDSEEHVVAKLTGDTLPTLQRILVRSSYL